MRLVVSKPSPGTQRRPGDAARAAAAGIEQPEPRPRLLEPGGARPKAGPVVERRRALPAFWPGHVPWGRRWALPVDRTSGRRSREANRGVFEHRPRDDDAEADCRLRSSPSAKKASRMRSRGLETAQSGRRRPRRRSRRASTLHGRVAVSTSVSSRFLKKLVEHAPGPKTPPKSSSGRSHRARQIERISAGNQASCTGPRRLLDTRAPRSPRNPPGARHWCSAANLRHDQLATAFGSCAASSSICCTGASHAPPRWRRSSDPCHRWAPSALTCFCNSSSRRMTPSIGALPASPVDEPVQAGRNAPSPWRPARQACEADGLLPALEQRHRADRSGRRDLPAPAGGTRQVCSSTPSEPAQRRCPAGPGVQRRPWHAPASRADDIDVLQHAVPGARCNRPRRGR